MADEPIKMTAFDTGQGFLKAGLFGFAGSGKTYTATLLAIEVRKHFELDGPIAFFDTEASAVFVNAMVKKATGQSMIGIRSRALSDLLEMARLCEGGAAGVLVVDSITHAWREVCDAYLTQVNEARASQGKSKRTRLEFQDWATIKAAWNKWTDFFLNSSLHIIICGRGGYEWAFEETEDASGRLRKELRKKGVKMKVEGEFAFEPPLLCYMERVPKFDEATEKPSGFTYCLTVLKDKSQVLNGAMCEDPTGDFFQPHLKLLTPGAKNVVDTKPKTPMDLDGAGDAEFVRDRRDKEILCEEIKGMLISAWPGQTAVDKKAKADALKACFGVRSWTAIEKRTEKERLKIGIDLLVALIEKEKGNG